jgi:flagellar hook-associated protein 3 FlgL
MRISTNTIFESGSGKIGDLQVGLNRTMQQISANRKILNPSDDPVGSARALVITQSDAINDQFEVNRRNVKNSLSIAEGVLGGVTTTLHNVKTSIISAGSGVLTDVERGFIANELQGHLDELLSFANSSDGLDGYLFSGFSASAPYSKIPGGAQYNGDQGQKSLQVDTSRQIQLSEVGTNIFGNIRTSSTQFNINPNASNTGQTVATAAINVPSNPLVTIMR